jgi:aryl-alcohol dehydrogenase-like predicted oxidoreductase
MEYRRLGDSGLKVSVVGLGTNNFGGRTDEAASRRVIDAAIDAGINLFDTADVYGRGKSEEIIGRGLQGRRDAVVIATKFRSSMGDGPNNAGGSRRYILQAVEASLRRLQTEYIDLYQMHSPDAETPIEETLETLDYLVRAGKVRYVGCSNFMGWQIADAAWVARTHHWNRFISAQNHYSLAERGVEREVIPACAHYGLGMLPYFPLEAGLLTGKYRRGEAAPTGTRLASSPGAGRFLTDAKFERAERLERFASERGISMLQVAIGGLAAQPQVASVIAGATKPEQITANVEAGGWKPTPAELAELNRVAPRPEPR